MLCRTKSDPAPADSGGELLYAFDAEVPTSNLTAAVNVSAVDLLLIVLGVAALVWLARKYL